MGNAASINQAIEEQYEKLKKAAGRADKQLKDRHDGRSAADGLVSVVVGERANLHGARLTFAARRSWIRSCVCNLRVPTSVRATLESCT